MRQACGLPHKVLFRLIAHFLQDLAIGNGTQNPCTCPDWSNVHAPKLPKKPSTFQLNTHWPPTPVKRYWLEPFVPNRFIGKPDCPLKIFLIASIGASVPSDD